MCSSRNRYGEKTYPDHTRSLRDHFPINSTSNRPIPDHFPIAFPALGYSIATRYSTFLTVQNNDVGSPIDADHPNHFARPVPNHLSLIKKQMMFWSKLWMIIQHLTVKNCSVILGQCTVCRSLQIRAISFPHRKMVLFVSGACIRGQILWATRVICFRCGL